MKTRRQLEREIEKLTRELEYYDRAEKLERDIKAFKKILTESGIEMSISSNCQCDHPQICFIYNGEQLLNNSFTFSNISDEV